MIYLLDDVMGKLDNCVKYKKPFSHIRFGDGGIKLIHSIVAPDHDQLRIIMKKEGLPQQKIVEIFELWGYYARRADFIDTPEVYFNDTFWPREKKPGKAINKPTEEKLRNWRRLYNDAEFDTDKYCNPETNFLMILKRENKPNLMDFMKNKRICLITARPQVKSVLSGYDIDIVKIVAHYENQYQNSFCGVMDIIRSTAKDYDFWMVAAGELGRIYTGEIKENGGRAIDIGFVIEFWLGGELHPRFLRFIKRINQHELILTKTGRKYEEYI
jgi:hypothetical protein